MPAASILHGALGALLSITVTADAPADRGLVARRLAEAGHTVVATGGDRRLHITADAIWMAPDDSDAIDGMPSRSQPSNDSNGIDGMPASARRVPLPRTPARRIVLPHHARALAGPPKPTSNTRPVVWLSGRGAVLDRVAAGLLDAGFALGWHEPLLAVCIGPEPVAVARGRRCGAPMVSREPVREAIDRSLRLARPPGSRPAPARPPPAATAPASTRPTIPAAPRPLEHGGHAYALRGAVGIDSRSWVTSSLALERAGALRWLVGGALRADASAAVRLGIGLGLDGIGTLDLTVDAGWGSGGAGWRIALPVGFGRRARVVVEPAWSRRGPAAALLLSFPL